VESELEGVGEKSGKQQGCTQHQPADGVDKLTHGSSSLGSLNANVILPDSLRQLRGPAEGDICPAVADMHDPRGFALSGSCQHIEPAVPCWSLRPCSEALTVVYAD
jgi:hypothetical protein